MALVTVTNTSGRAINRLAVGEDSIAVGLDYAKSHRYDPLPYPFEHIGELANSASKVLTMQPMDFWNQRTQMHQSLNVKQEWQQLVQSGIVTFAVAAQTDNRDVEELFDAIV